METVVQHLERFAVLAAQKRLTSGEFVIALDKISAQCPELFSFIYRAMWTSHRSVILCVGDIWMKRFLVLLFERAITLARGGSVESLAGQPSSYWQQLADLAAERFSSMSN